MRMPGKSYAGPAPASQPEGPRALRLMEDIHMLAEQIGERNLDHPAALEETVGYLDRRFRGCGYEQVKRQTYAVGGVDVHNLEVAVPGTVRPHEVVIVGAHYDSAQGTPGADDNASGVAAMLELACEFVKVPGERTVTFVAYVNEEPPYFQTETMGSLVHARRLPPDHQVLGMLSLETLGYYREEAKTQRYPALMAAFYPDEGNFLTFVGNRKSKKLLKRAITVFREHATLPSEGGLAPASIPGVGWSDHWSYWQVGIPAIMVTDTALFRNPHYHKPTDTPAVIDPVRLSLAVRYPLEPRRTPSEPSADRRPLPSSRTKSPLCVTGTSSKDCGASPTCGSSPTYSPAPSKR